jgi:hypothetical protein
LAVSVSIALLLWLANSNGAFDWHSKRDVSERTAQTLPVAPGNASSKPNGNQAEAVAPLKDAPLPQPDLPLTDVAAALRSAAVEGNSPAACRLAMELLRCRQHQRDLRAAGELAKLGGERAVDRDLQAKIDIELRAIDDRIKRDRVVCQGAGELRDEPWQLLLGAAQSGHVPSMSKFAVSSAVREENGRGEWSPDAIAAYRTFSLTYLTRASEAGDVAATEKLGFELMALGTGTRAVPFDPVRGLAYLKALLASASPAYRAELAPKVDTAILYAGLQPQQISAAESLAITILPPSFPKDGEGRIVAPKESPDNNFGCQ